MKKVKNIIWIIALILVIVIKQYKPEFALYISIAAGLIIFFLVIDKLSGIIDLLMNLSNKANINQDFIIILLKITGIAILSEFAISVCKDAGEAAIASKIDFGAKIIMVAISIPIIASLLEMILKVMT